MSAPGGDNGLSAPRCAGKRQLPIVRNPSHPALHNAQLRNDSFCCRKLERSSNGDEETHWRRFKVMGIHPCGHFISSISVLGFGALSLETCVFLWFACFYHTLLSSCLLDGLYQEEAKALLGQYGPKDLTGFCHLSFVSPATH